MLIRSALILVFVVTLAGCTSPQQRASNECQNQGFSPGTALFGQCYQATMARYQQGNIYLMNTGLTMMQGGR